MNKTHRTAQGRVIDMAAMATQHEKVRAVGNMNMNARGDIVDSNNNVIKSRVQQTNQHYNRSVSQNIQERPTAPAPKPAARTPTPDPVIQEKNQEPISGLAAAMARAQQIKDED